MEEAQVVVDRRLQDAVERLGRLPSPRPLLEPREARAQRGVPRAKHALDDGGVEVVLRAEEVVRRAARQPGLATDLRKARAVEAAVGEQALGGVEERLAAA